MYEDEPTFEGTWQSKPAGSYTPTTNYSNPNTLPHPPKRNAVPRRPVPVQKPSTGQADLQDGTKSPPPTGRINSWDGQDGGPPTALAPRDESPTKTPTSPFPLSDIDYESSPAAVAQELSNLQALRRMSMDVAAAGDPDLPSLSHAGMPMVAPSPSSSEDDSSRLFWVPARLHPELAPKEFKSFLENKAEQIRRRSGDQSQFSSGQSSRSSLLDSGVGLRRKKSMLSRQIDNSNGKGAEGYLDGAERLECKRSMSERAGQNELNLEELEQLVTDRGLLKRLSLEGQTSAGDDPSGDIILPSVPGSSLKRSKRTQYRKGGSKANSDRPTYSRRVGRGGSVTGAGISAESSLPDVPPLPSIPSTATSKSSPSWSSPAEPSKTSTNFSRPAARSPSPPTTFDSMLSSGGSVQQPSTLHQSQVRQWQSELGAQDQTRPKTSPDRPPVPQIVETPPPPESIPLHSHPLPTASVPLTSASATTANDRLPERKSSREDFATTQSQRPPVVKQPTPVNLKRPGSRGTGVPQQTQGLDHMSTHPSPLPGMDTNTRNLSFIPTLTEDKKADNKRIKDKRDEPRKSSWGWLLGKEESNKEKREDGSNSKAKAKAPKVPDKHDNTRLDVLQTSIDAGSKGRESLVLDRDSLKLDEERKRESRRKSAGADTKKEKDGLFSSIFGGVKKHKDKDGSSKKHGNQSLSPEPSHRELKPDIDYNWTRFTILEERAIYRMAHIKLANPRRALYSQVLLSNFMYSYLAKVQQMHPQMNLPTSAKQQQDQKKQQQHVQDQHDEYAQYQRYQQASDAQGLMISIPTLTS